MRRDIGNEIIVAIAAIGMLAIGVAFVIILSLSRNAEDNLTPTAPNGTAQALVPSAPQNSDTATSIVVTATFTHIPPTATVTPQPPTQTPQPTAAATETAQDTIKPKPTTAQPIPTNTASPAVAASATPRPTTAVPIQRPTDVPSATPSPIPTTAAPSATSVPASSTPIPSATLTPSSIPPTATPTVKPSATPLPPSSTPRPTATSTATAVPPTKPPPPPTKAVPPPTAQPAGTVASTNGVLVAEGCTDSGVQISNLTPGQTVKGVMTLIGTAYNQDLLYYKLETRPDFSQFYTLYNRFETVIIQNELGAIDSSIFPPGLYWIRLTVVNKDGTMPAPCAIPVMFQG
jgi:hypothetical protein